MAKVRSKHSNLLNYFIHDRRDLSPAYVRSCEKFFKSLKLQAREDIIHEENERLLDRSNKRQASSLTDPNYRIIKETERKKI